MLSKKPNNLKTLLLQHKFIVHYFFTLSMEDQKKAEFRLSEYQNYQDQFTNTIPAI